MFSIYSLKLSFWSYYAPDTPPSPPLEGPAEVAACKSAAFYSFISSFISASILFIAISWSLKDFLNSSPLAMAACSIYSIFSLIFFNFSSYACLANSAALLSSESSSTTYLFLAFFAMESA